MKGPIYSKTGTASSPTPLPDGVILDIGCLVRNFALIEAYIDILIQHVANVNASTRLIMLGRAGVSTKIDMLGKLATISGSPAREVHDKYLIDDAFREALNIRNAVAHSMYLGVGDNGDYLFYTNNFAGIGYHDVAVAIVGISPETIGNCVGITKAVSAILAALAPVKLALSQIPAEVNAHRKASPQR